MLCSSCDETHSAGRIDSKRIQDDEQSIEPKSSIGCFLMA
jgi:hypothetical protein